MLFLVREGDPFDPALFEVERSVATVPGIASTVSPLSLEVLESDGAGGLSARMLRPEDDHPLAVGALIATDGSAGAIAATVSDTHNFPDARATIVSKVEAAVQASADRDGSTWHLAGVPMVRIAYIRLMLADLMTLLPLALAVSSIFFVLTSSC